MSDLAVQASHKAWMRLKGRARGGSVKGYDSGGAPDDFTPAPIPVDQPAQGELQRTPEGYPYYQAGGEDEARVTPVAMTTRRPTATGVPELEALRPENQPFRPFNPMQPGGGRTYSQGPAALGPPTGGGAPSAGQRVQGFKGLYPYDPESGPIRSGSGRVISETPLRELTEINTPGKPYAGFFSSDPEVANRFAGVLSGSAGMRAALTFENPLVIDAKGKPAAAFQFESVAREHKVLDDYNAFQSVWNDPQRDGVILKNTKDEGTVYVPRNPHQITPQFGEMPQTGGSQPPVGLENLTVNSILHPDTPAQPARSRNVEDIAAELHARGQGALTDMGVPGGRIEESHPEHDEIISHALASEVQGALNRPGANAADWYTGKVREAMAVASTMHPEIAQDPLAKTAYTAALAITSQGETVPSNVRLAEQAYRAFKETGRFPETVAADKGAFMGDNFAKLNSLIDDKGLQGMHDFLHTQMTARDLKQLGYAAATKEKMDAPVHGSAILGPKIGGGFFQNLNGNYDPVTMDLWFMRGWGRLTGTLVGKPDIAAQKERLVNALTDAGAKVPRTQDGLLKTANDLITQHEQDFRANRADFDSGAKAKSELTYAAERYQKALQGINETPTSGGQRAWMRDRVNRAREILANNGTNITNADLQAIWWYPEKHLYAKLGGRDAEAINTDYATVLRNVAKTNGVSDDAIERAVRAASQRPGPARAPADDARANESGGQGSGRVPRAQAPDAGETAAGAPGAVGGGSLAQAQAEAARIGGPRVPLAGLPRGPFTLAGQSYVPGPNAQLHDIAEDYMRGTGQPYQPPSTYQKVDKERAGRIAQAFDQMKHDPTDPHVAASYDAMINETLAQFQAIKKAGIKFEFIKPGQKDPYEESPRLAAKDVAENGHLWVFPTDLGHGTTDQAALKNNPMLRPTNEEIDGHRLVANDVFRIVHDVFGHLKDGNGFRADGEENAWRSHSAMYSDLARPAMTSETRGQNSWLNYGPHGAKNRTAKSADTVYADQKVGLLPQWAIDEGRSDPQGLSFWSEPLRRAGGGRVIMKLTHAEAGYHRGPGKTGSHCSICARFIARPPGCDVVQSPIRPEDGCDLFKPRKRAAGGRIGFQEGGAPEFDPSAPATPELPSFDPSAASTPEDQGAHGHMTHEQLSKLSNWEYLKERFNYPQDEMSLPGAAGSIYRGVKQAYETARQLGAGELDPSTVEGANRAISEVVPYVTPMSPAAGTTRAIAGAAAGRAGATPAAVTAEAVARQRAADEFGINYSRGQATGDVGDIRFEDLASRGTYGTPAQNVAQPFFEKQFQEIGQAGRDVGQTLARDQNVAATQGEAAGTVTGEVGAAATRAQQVRDAAAAQAAQDADATRMVMAAREAAMRRSIRGQTPAIEGPREAGELVGQGVRDEAAAARAAYQARYQQAMGLPGEFAPEALQGVGGRIQGALTRGADPVIVDDVTTPMASRAVRDLDDVSNLRIQDRAAPDGTMPQPIDLRGVDQARKRLVAFYRAARTSGNAADARAVGRVIDEFDNQIEGAISNGLFSGDPAALSALQEARGAYSQYARTFRPQQAGDDVGNAMRRIIDRQATPEEISNMILGSGRLGNAGLPVRLADRLEDVLGGNSNAWGAIRQALWQRASQVRDRAGDVDMGRSAQSILDFTGSSLGQRMFSPAELAAMRAHAQGIRNLDQVVQRLPSTQRAAQLQTAYESMFGGAGLEGNQGRVFGRIVDGTATPQETAQAVFNSIGGGNPGNTVRLIDAIERIAGPQSDTMAAIRQGIWHKLTSNPIGKDQPGQQKLAQSVNEFLNGKGRDIANRVFSENERQLMARYAIAVQRTVIPKYARTNSDTAPALMSVVNRLGSGVAALVAAHTHPILGLGVGKMIERAATGAREAQSARRVGQQFNWLDNASPSPQPPRLSPPRRMPPSLPARAVLPALSPPSVAPLRQLQGSVPAGAQQNQNP